MNIVFNSIGLLVMILALILIFKFVSGILKIITLFLVISALLYFLYGITIDINKLINNVEKTSEHYYNNNDSIKQVVDIFKDIGEFLKNLITSSKSE